MPGLQVPELLPALQAGERARRSHISMAQRKGALIAAHCGASYFLARCGVIDASVRRFLC